MVCYVKNGDKGVMVKAVQVKLKANGKYNYQIDSNAGPKTIQGIKDYQKSKGLVVDGCVGPITWKSLFGVDYPNTIKKSTAVTYNSDKTDFLKRMATAIGGKFNTLEECYDLIRKNEDYRFYVGDKYAQKDAVDNLQKGIGDNCVDFSQLLKAVADDLNKVAKKGYETRYVRTYCTKDKVGHVYLEVRGGEFSKSFWTSIDGAAAASDGSKYPIGKAWCQEYKDKIYNPDYLKLDDGKT